ncbi:DUF4870 domain-containing protein [Aequorivita sp. CIP111184]|uniref:DUF4870 domain-containing protein n=1 Tax=Aequorivita sp. CIP111184 TaxID=2211356 RepID=UPI000DBBE246|nr:hypothetical protein [Aequorivita sp. CIP111184]SRX55400.1 hypothetical protein AEQU1_02422 [Aequorivita sp. CIP111184]
MENDTNSQTQPNTSSIVIEEGKTIALIAYITIFGLIIAFVMNNEKKNSFAAYHIRQSLGLGITGLALSIINVIPILGWLISILGSIFLIILWIIGLMGAINGKEKPVPLLGEKFQELLKNI